MTRAIIAVVIMFLAACTYSVGPSLSKLVDYCRSSCDNRHEKLNADPPCVAFCVGLYCEDHRGEAACEERDNK